MLTGPGEHRVAVGLSGGVDSSLTAALLVEAGWEVEGLTLWLMSGKGACCAEGLVDAAGICDQLEVPHHVVDFRDHFKHQIVDFLVEGYAAGVTPLPCSRCNREVKFGPMLNWAENERSIHRIATGHYARVRHGDQSDNGRHQLLRGLDTRKDQSYFLYDLPQDVLGRLVFPLGELTKPDTRLEAERFGLRTAQKPESQDLCLADHHGSMKAFLDTYLAPREGQIVLVDGTVLGTHDGIEHFTIGQRKGLGIAWREPLQRFAPGDAKSFSLTDREVFDAVVGAQHGAVDEHNLSFPRCQVGVEEGLHRAVMIGQAEILALRLLRGAKAEALCLQPGVRFGQFAKGEHQPSQHVLRKVIQEVALILASIQASKQLMATVVALVSVAHSGVMASRDAVDRTFVLSPVEHWPELHLTVASGAGQWCDSGRVSLHQEVNDLMFEVVAKVNDVMGHLQLVADAGSIHQTFGTTGTFAAHQPEGETFHLPSSLHKKGCGERTVDAS